jgi:electron transport complex protein RnfA
MNLFLILVSSSLVSNVVLSRFLGICPFLGVSKKTDTAFGMGLAVLFVITIATAVTYSINEIFLKPTGIFKIDLTYLQTIVFILVIAALVQFVEMFLKKYIVSLYESLGVYLPLITTNCAVLGVALSVVEEYTFIEAIVYGVGTSIGFLISIVLLASIRERNEYNDVPECFKCMPITLITAGLMAITFFGFSGMVK